jgi:hypothetical protein
MMYIVLNNGNEFPWWIDKKVPSVQSTEIKEIQADGDELAYLNEVFPNFPWPVGRRVVVVPGEMSRYMYRNL